MPKSSLHVFIWSEKYQRYELQSHGHPNQWFHPGDEPAFTRWLEEHTSFAFVGQAGRLSVIKEGRPGGRGYWYAYHKQARHTHKGYLGLSAQVTFARLEEQARSLGGWSPSPTLARDPVRPVSALSIPLLSTKLVPPRVPSFLVERPRLLNDLDAIWTHPLTLVSASAGSGKTTLLSAWVSRQEHCVAWLSLDAMDNDPIRFWTACIAALRRCLPTLGEEAFALLHSREAPPLSTILATLLNEIMQADREVIFILDDYHVIEDQAIHHGLLFLLDHMPATLHLVLATRTDPELPLSRLRVRGQMVEIRSSDLRFTQEETASFLVQSMRLPLTEEDVSRTFCSRRAWSRA